MYGTPLETPVTGLWVWMMENLACQNELQPHSEKTLQQSLLTSVKYVWQYPEYCKKHSLPYLYKGCTEGQDRSRCTQMTSPQSKAFRLPSGAAEPLTVGDQLSGASQEPQVTHKSPSVNLQQDKICDYPESSKITGQNKQAIFNFFHCQLCIRKEIRVIKSY